MSSLHEVTNNDNKMKARMGRSVVAKDNCDRIGSQSSRHMFLQTSSVRTSSVLGQTSCRSEPLLLCLCDAPGRAKLSVRTSLIVFCLRFQKICDDPHSKVNRRQSIVYLFELLISSCFNLSISLGWSVSTPSSFASCIAPSRR